jgi:hypothetical protein
MRTAMQVTTDMLRNAIKIVLWYQSAQILPHIVNHSPDIHWIGGKISIPQEFFKLNLHAFGCRRMNKMIDLCSFLPRMLSHPSIDHIQVSTHVLGREMGFRLTLRTIPIVDDETNISCTHESLSKQIEAMICHAL